MNPISQKRSLLPVQLTTAQSFAIIVVAAVLLALLVPVSEPKVAESVDLNQSIGSASY